MIFVWCNALFFVRKEIEIELILPAERILLSYDRGRNE